MDKQNTISTSSDENEKTTDQNVWLKSGSESDSDPNSPGLSDLQTFNDRTGSDLTNDEVSSDTFSTPEYLNLVQFAFKLGFNESQLKSALLELGTTTPKHNDLLKVLLKSDETGRDEDSDPEEDDYTVQPDDLLLQPEAGESTKEITEGSNFRTIVIDGSNVAMSHGNKEMFSCLGIQLAVDFFRQRGHEEIIVFVPQWRKETPRPDSPIKNQEVLYMLEKEKILVYTPSRRVAGKRVVCYDDRYVIKVAADTDGIIVSNDNYRDLMNEDPAYKKVVEERLLMYSFVNDRFLPPADPLGRHGPTLDNFLLKEPNLPETLPPICPYLKKCTYGNKCKFYHPERGNKPRKLITEKLAEEAQLRMLEVKERQTAEPNLDPLDVDQRWRGSKDDTKPSMEGTEKQRKLNENLDHYRKQVEASERERKAVKFKTPQAQDHPGCVPPNQDRVSDGTHLAVAKSLSDQPSTGEIKKPSSARRLSVPSASSDTENLARRFARQASLQTGNKCAAWCPHVPQTGPVYHGQVLSPPPHSAGRSYPPAQTHAMPNDFGGNVAMSDLALRPPYYDNQVPLLASNNPGPRFQQYSLPLKYPAVNQHTMPDGRYPPFGVPERSFGAQYQSSSMMPTRSHGLHPEYRHQGSSSHNTYPNSYVTGPPVENEFNYDHSSAYEMQAQVMPPGSRYNLSPPGTDTIPPPNQLADPQRYSIYVNLSNIYGEEVIRMVMHQHPNENRAHVIATFAAQVPPGGSAVKTHVLRN